jgi:hypothetical protein
MRLGASPAMKRKTAGWDRQLPTIPFVPAPLEGLEDDPGSELYLPLRRGRPQKLPCYPVLTFMWDWAKTGESHQNTRPA